ncbi:MAG: glycosyltransferase family 39 protein [Candidatus Omnitrophica bacterium]|nr:glycosyltransferase family 39 protein [Candidatus Omnitrophota bacterium]
MQKSKEKIVLGIILTCAFLLRLVWVYLFSPPELTSDPLAYHGIALKILSGEGFRHGVKFAFMPPAYPFFLAGIYKVFGISSLAVKLVQVILSTLTCGFMFALGKMLVSRRAGVWAALFCAFYPQMIRYAGELWSETLFLTFFTGALFFLLKSLSGNWKNPVLAGIFLGGSALVREIGFLFVIPVLLWLFLVFQKKGRMRFVISKGGLIAVSMAVVVLPWVIRNYYIFGKVVPIATNGGINFYIGNNPRTTGEFQWVLPEGIQWPDCTPGIDEEAIKVMELEAGRQGYRQGMAFIRNNPARFFKLVLKRLYFYWAPPYFNLDFRAWSPEMLFRLLWVLFDACMLVLGFLGMWIALFSRDRRWLLLHFWILMITAIGALMYYSPRYRLPMVPAMVLFSALAAEAFFNKHFKNTLKKL